MRTSALVQFLVTRPAILSLSIALATLIAPLAAPQPSYGFAYAHAMSATGAVDVLSPELQELWQQPIVYSFDSSPQPRPIEYWLSERFTYIPDLIDGPGDPESVAQRRYLADYVYAEKAGQQAPAWAFSDPDKPAWRPRTFHYMAFSTDENREFARRAADWYFHQMVSSFQENDGAAAAMYGGAFAHAIQDRTSPVHIWDGVDDVIEREAFEDSLADFGLQEPANSFNNDPSRWSLFWIFSDRNLSGELEGYEPQILGDTIEEASQAFAWRLEMARDEVRDLLTDPQGFVNAHLTDDWTRRKSSPATDAFQQLALDEATMLTADVWQTAFHLSQVPEPTGGLALLFGTVVMILRQRR